MLDTNEAIVYIAIKDYITEKKFSPTMRELCDITDFKSTATIHKYIKRLENKGYIKRDKILARCITLSEHRLKNI